MNNNDAFQTIRQIAKSSPLSEHYLRNRLKENRLPGFYTGTRFIVDVPALMDMLHRESLEACEP